MFRQEVTHLVTIQGAPARTTTFTVLGDTCPVSVPGGPTVDAVPHILLQVWPLSSLTRFSRNIWYKFYCDFKSIRILSSYIYSYASIFLDVVKEAVSMSKLVRHYNYINTNLFSCLLISWHLFSWVSIAMKSTKIGAQ